jgi:hypothetical protein
MEEVKDKLLVILKRMERAINEMTNENYNDKESVLANNYYMITRYFTLYREYLNYDGQWNQIKNIPVE